MISKIHKKLPTSCASYGLLTIVIVYAAFFAAYSLQKHAAFQTAGFDLGIWDQKVWNILHGRPFIITTQASVSTPKRSVPKTLISNGIAKIATTKGAT